jgi:hypothetical protein
MGECDEALSSRLSQRLSQGALSLPEMYPLVVVVFSAIALIGACLLRACPGRRLPSVHRVYTDTIQVPAHRPESFTIGRMTLHDKDLR